MWPLQDLAFNYQMTRDFPAALATVDRALKLDPQSLALLSLKAHWSLQQGESAAAEEALGRLAAAEANGERSEQVTAARIPLLVLQRKWMEALQATLKLSEPQLAKLNDPGAVVSKYLTEGIARQCLQQDEEARAALLKAKTLAERSAEQAPNDPRRHLNFAYALADLGEKEAAIAEARRATDLSPEAIDAFEGPVMAERLAEVYAIVGENDRAIDLLNALLSRPSDVTISMLENAPGWGQLARPAALPCVARKISCQDLDSRCSRSGSRSPERKRSGRSRRESRSFRVRGEWSIGMW